MARKAGRPKKGEIVKPDDQYSNARTKVAHFVRRSGIVKKCVVCGNPGAILHNRENPYMIAFICDECRKDPEKEKKAESLRFDIRNKVPKRGTHILRTSSNEYITKTVENYLKDTLPIREYCRKIGISNKQFHSVVDRYKELYPDQPIDAFIKSHRDTIHRHRIKESKSVDV